MTTYVALGGSFASGPGIEPVDVTSGGATVDDVLARPQSLLTGGTVPPQIEAGGCPGLPMTDDDVRFCAGIGRRLEEATAAAARTSGAQLVRASGISRDHTACHPEPWVTGWEFGDLLAGGVAPYHPNAEGMRAVADAVVRALAA